MRNSSSGGVRIERVSSIELEPRTLTLDQLQYARVVSFLLICCFVDQEFVVDEYVTISKLHFLFWFQEEALFILSTKSSDEAFSIFTQGLEPVLSITSKRMMEEVNEINRQPFEKVGTTLFEGKRDIATAPF
ncbi:hypothetical protein J5N97_021078 [Dioscorea zingiberensis]|uniref:Uncharacterized protein n=1 Tax=Dioscorea zingiberensis TaxID=325984 RepID=A0A9D5CHJ8_9LILI|nr:hypothetical protein J5N97_021078 [Dioscorea zingiberensis]